MLTAFFILLPTHMCVHTYREFARVYAYGKNSNF